jgi:hypothetical protein
VGDLLQVKGSAIFSRLRWVRDTHGEDSLKELLSDLSPAGRNLIHHQLDRRAWYNFPLFMELCTAIDRKWGKGDLSLNIELARFGCKVNVPALYQPFIRLGSVDWVLGKSEKFWDEHFSHGKIMVKREPGTHHADGEIIDFPAPHMALCYSVLGFAMGCVELSGEKHVRGEMVSCRARGAPRCLMKVYWGDEA